MSDVTRILDRVQQGDLKAAGELLPLVYEELRKLAVVRMANEKPGQTLRPGCGWLVKRRKLNSRTAPISSPPPRTMFLNLKP